MIIVKAGKDTVFINEKEYKSVEHKKEQKFVECWDGNRYELTIRDVESVQYVNDAQPFEFKDEGSELEDIKRNLKCVEEKYTTLMELQKSLYYFFARIDMGFYDNQCDYTAEEIRNIVKNFNESKREIYDAMKKYNKEYERIVNEYAKPATD